VGAVSDPEATVLGTPQKAYAGYPAPFVFDQPNGRKIEQTIWGDYIGLKGTVGDWVEVRARGADGFMRAGDVQSERLLEVNFIDVGQGDGCFIVTPEDEFLLVDAGQLDNMLRFLYWRFNLRRHPGLTIDFDVGVITHPDQDHYGGFDALFDSDHFHFRSLYHNGLVERSGAGLGTRQRIGDVTYQTDVVSDMAALRTIIDDDALVGRSRYPNLLRSAVRTGQADDIRMADAGALSHLPGYEAGRELSIEVLGPVSEQVAVGGAPRTVLRRFGSDDGITKNGHSVTLRLRYRDVTILLTGDLNSHSERYLLQHYTGLDPASVDAVERTSMITKARERFSSHAAKSCHHGSADFVDEFLASIESLVTVVSSGDDEPFAHPRPDALGALGRWGRGSRPLIFSTELARSPSENIKQTAALRRDLERLESLWAAAATDLEKEQLRKVIEDRLDRLERAVAVYGLINLRTDGRKLLMAQKLERPSPSGVKWDVHQLEFVDGELQPV
jgi:beta-lactamase superfamily II metal-dependent hydrolase